MIKLKKHKLRKTEKKINKVNIDESSKPKPGSQTRNSFNSKLGLNQEI
jgi:hypothetical protein